MSPSSSQRKSKAVRHAQRSNVVREVARVVALSPRMYQLTYALLPTNKVRPPATRASSVTKQLKRRSRFVWFDPVTFVEHRLAGELVRTSPHVTGFALERMEDSFGLRLAQI